MECWNVGSDGGNPTFNVKLELQIRYPTVDVGFVERCSYVHVGLVWSSSQRKHPKRGMKETGIPRGAFDLDEPIMDGKSNHMAVSLSISLATSTFLVPNGSTAHRTGSHDSRLLTKWGKF